MRKLIQAMDKGLAAAVSTVVVVLLLAMVLLSFTQVVLRNLLDQGLPWAEVVLQHGVLAVGMFGAVLAARQGRQIAIDVLSRVVGSIGRTVLSWIGGLFTIAISGVLARAAWVFVASEKEFGSELFSGLPAWPFQVVIPLGFALIALQMVFNLLLGRTTQPEVAEGTAALDPTLVDADKPAPIPEDSPLLPPDPASDEPDDEEARS